MPIYTYRCQKCRAVFRKTQSFSDRPLTRCPACLTNSMRRVPQLPAIIFKGSGWYSTDHRCPFVQTGPRPEKNGQAKSPTGARTER